MHLTLVIPNLLLPAQSTGLLDVYGDLTLPNLEFLLGRMNHLALPAQPLESWLCDTFGVAPDPDIPAGALSLLADDGKPGEAYWLRADPVHLEPQRDQLVLVEGDQLAISRGEADQLVAALNEHFFRGGQSFHAIDSMRWYLRFNKPLELLTHPTSVVAGRGIGNYMASGFNATKLAQLMTEVQMLLHTHPVNQAREAQGLPPINSIWPWGGGRLPAVSERPYAHVWSNDPLALGLAHASHSLHSQLPAHAHAVIEEDVASSHTLVVLDNLRSAASYGNYANWQKSLRILEEKWMAPLTQAYRKGRIRKLTLHALNDDQHLVFTLRRSARWAIWRRPSPLSRYAA